MGAPHLITDPYLYGNRSMAGSIEMDRSFLKLTGPEEDVGYEFRGFQNPAVEDPGKPCALKLVSPVQHN